MTEREAVHQMALYIPEGLLVVLGNTNAFESLRLAVLLRVITYYRNSIHPQSCSCTFA